MSFEAMLNESLGNLTFKPDTVVEAKVVSIDRYFVTVDANLPIEGHIPSNEFEILPSVGDNVKVIIDALDDGTGKIEISHARAAERETREMINIAIDEKNIMSAKVISSTRAGLLVRIGSIDGFLPNSLIDTVMINKESLIGQAISVIPLSVDTKKKNVIVSRKEALIQERGGAMEQLEGELQVGDIREGIIKNTVKFGAFVDLGGKDCLIHITDMGWDVTKINPFKDFEIGQRVKGLINKTDSLGRFYMSLKSVDMAPWEKAKSELKVGDKVKCIVYKVDDNKNLIVVVNGVSGLIENCDISWTHIKPHELHQTYTTGKEVEAVVTGFNEESGNEFVALSIKEGTHNPWTNIESSIKVDSVIKTTIKAITEHNVFVSIAEGIDAIIPFKEISWEDSAVAIKKLEVGNEVDVKILNFDKTARKITGSIREVTENPFVEIQRGKEVNCVITGFSRRGDIVFVDVSNGSHCLKGIVSARHATASKLIKANEYYSVGDNVVGTVISIDSGKVMINLRNKESKKLEGAMGATSVNSMMKQAMEDATR